MKKAGLFLTIVFCLTFLSTIAFAESSVEYSKGQTVYAFAGYNDIGPSQATSTRLIIRNLDGDNSMTLKSVKFFSPENVEEHDYLLQSGPIVIQPRNSITFAASWSVLQIPR